MKQNQGEADEKLRKGLAEVEAVFGQSAMSSVQAAEGGGTALAELRTMMASTLKTLHSFEEAKGTVHAHTAQCIQDLQHLQRKLASSTSVQSRSAPSENYLGRLRGASDTRRREVDNFLHILSIHDKKVQGITQITSESTLAPGRKSPDSLDAIAQFQIRDNDLIDLTLGEGSHGLIAALKDDLRLKNQAIELLTDTTASLCQQLSFTKSLRTGSSLDNDDFLPAAPTVPEELTRDFVAALLVQNTELSIQLKRARSLERENAELKSRLALAQAKLDALEEQAILAQRARHDERSGYRVAEGDSLLSPADPDAPSVARTGTDQDWSASGIPGQPFSARSPTPRYLAGPGAPFELQPGKLDYSEASPSVGGRGLPMGSPSAARGGGPQRDIGNGWDLGNGPLSTGSGGGRILAVLAVMRAAPKDAEVQAEACAALEALADGGGGDEGGGNGSRSGAASVAALIAEHGLGVVLAGMRSNLSDPAAAAAHCSLLRRLAEEDSGARLLAAADAHTPLLEAMRQHAGAVVVQRAGCGALCGLLRVEGFVDRAAAAALPAIVRAMRGQPDDGATQADGCSALLGLCGSTGSSGPAAAAERRLAVREQGLGLVVVAMRRHPGRPDVQQAAAAVLWMLRCAFGRPALVLSFRLFLPGEV